MSLFPNIDTVRYSVVISPPDAVIGQVRQLKQQLRQAIGWYGSVSALAHITFNVFEAGTEALQRWELYTAGFAIQQQPVYLQFPHTGTFANGAFFLAPDEDSDQCLIRMMQAFHLQAPLPARQSAMPHMSIGRRLSAAQLAIAQSLIRDTDIHFECRDLVLRRFNETRRQYDIYKRFPFRETQ